MGVGRNFKRTLGERPGKIGVWRAPSIGPRRGPKAAQARGEPSRCLTLENADACLKISSAESASSSPRSCGLWAGDERKGSFDELLAWHSEEP